MRSTNSKPQPSNHLLMDKIESRPTLVLVLVSDKRHNGEEKIISFRLMLAAIWLVDQHSQSTAGLCWCTTRSHSCLSHTCLHPGLEGKGSFGSVHWENPMWPWTKHNQYCDYTTTPKNVFGH